MSQESQVIQLLTDAAGSFIHAEALAAAASAIVPGMLVEETAAGEVQEQGTAAAAAQKAFALSNLSNAGTIDDVYGVGATVRYGFAHSGQPVFALVAAGAGAIVAGGAVEAAGDGTLRAATGANIIGYAMESVDNSGGGTTARIKVRVA